MVDVAVAVCLSARRKCKRRINSNYSHHHRRLSHGNERAVARWRQCDVKMAVGLLRRDNHALSLEKWQRISFHNLDALRTRNESPTAFFSYSPPLQPIPKPFSISLFFVFLLPRLVAKRPTSVIAEKKKQRTNQDEFMEIWADCGSVSGTQQSVARPPNYDYRRRVAGGQQPDATRIQKWKERDGEKELDIYVKRFRDNCVYFIIVFIICVCFHACARHDQIQRYRWHVDRQRHWAWLVGFVDIFVWNAPEPKWWMGERGTEWGSLCSGGDNSVSSIYWNFHASKGRTIARWLRIERHYFAI